jgi:hypothetical protein
LSAQPAWPLTNGPPGNAQEVLLQSLLVDRLAANPGLQQVLPLLGMTPSAGTPSNGAADGSSPDLAADRSAAYAAMADAASELRRMHALLDRVGRAVGACVNCLGSDPTCLYCSGTGRPGSGPLDEDLLPWLLQPLLDRLDDAEPDGSNHHDEPRTAHRPTGR